MAVPLTAHSPKLLKRGLLKAQRPANRFKIRRYGLIASNVVIVALITFFVLNNPKTDSLSLTPPSDSTISQTAVNPLDQVSSADIALTVAQLDNLPESTAVANQAQTAAANVAMAATTDNVVAKPQVVTTALKSRADIFTYTTVAGDTVASLSTKFGVTTNSIMWSNGLTGNTLNPGTKLTIPPVNGIVYTVKPGDTPATLAAKYNASEAEIVAYNDAEINGITPGEQIIIPSGTLPGTGSPAANTGTSFAWGGGSPIYGSYNGYDLGYCTWYVATQVRVPSNWGNASSWAYYAALSGWNVSTTPTVGSIAQTALAAGGEGHVAMVEAVNGSQVEIRDMNNYGDGGGWDRVGQGWVSISAFQHYITP